MTLERLPTADGTVLAVRSLGPRDADEVVVVLHGFTGDGDSMRELGEALALTRRVLLVDVIGHGESDAPDHLEPYHMSSVVDQVLSIIGPVPVGTAHLLGYSMGGRIVLSMLARAPWFFGSGVVISGSPGIEDPSARAERQRVDAARADELTRHGLDAFLSDWVALPLFDHWRACVGPDGLARSIAMRQRGTAVGYANSLLGTGTGAMPPVWDRLGAIRSPLLFVAGELDVPYVETANEMAERSYRGEVAVVEDAGHVTHIENPGAVARVVVEFLEGLPQRTIS